MESEHRLQEKNRFRTFLIFALLLSSILNVGFSINSSHFRIKTIEIDAEIDRYPQSRFSWVEAKPNQGRTHQIRRHLKHLSHPIIGDARYGKGKYNRYFAEHLDAGRLLLHAHQLTIQHPINHQNLTFTANLEGHMAALFKSFNWLPCNSPASD